MEIPLIYVGSEGSEEENEESQQKIKRERTKRKHRKSRKERKAKSRKRKTIHRIGYRPSCIPNQNPTRIVLAGSGAKVVAILGAFCRIVELVPDFLADVSMWIGTSAGAIFSLLMCCGYTIQELQKELNELDMISLLNYNIPNLLVGKGMGLDDGSRYLEWLSVRMLKKGVSPSITLQQLKDLTGKSLVTVTTDLYTRTTQYFTPETEPDFPALLATRASFGIPLWFTKVFYKGRCLIDGGLTMNFAFEQFTQNLSLDETAFGVDLSFVRAPHQGDESLVEYVSLLGELFVGLQQTTQESQGFQGSQESHQKEDKEERHKVHYITLSRQYPLLMATEDDKDDLFEDGYHSVI